MRIRAAAMALILTALPAGEIVAQRRADPQAAEKHWRLATAYLEKGLARHALAEARIALKLDPEHAGAKALVGRGETGAGGMVTASLYSAARRAYGEGRETDARRLAGDVLRRESSHAGARALIEALDEETYRPRPLAPNDLLRQIFEEGIGFYRRQEWEAAGETFQKGMASSPEHPQFRLFFERCRGRMEDKRIAELLEEARAAWARKDELAARAALSKALAIRPDHIDVLALRESWGLDPEADSRRSQIRAHFNLGVEAYEEGRWSDAIREWELVQGLSPGDEDVERLLRKARGKLGAARAKARKRAAQLHQDALKLYQRGKIEEARRIYRRILELDPDDEKARRSLSMIEGGI